MLMLERWGTWTLTDVLEPAIHYATHGVPVLDRIAATVGSVERLFLDDWPTSAATWLPQGKVPGGRLTNPVLAATYRRLVAEAKGSTREARIAAARDLWYRGFVAEAIADFSAKTAWRDSSGEVHGGLLAGDDLAGWSASVEEPATFDYRGHTVCKTGPWGQGPVFLQQLALLSGFDLDAMGHLSADYVHTVVESAKLAFADREAWYGDVEVPMDDLLGEPYNAGRRALVGVTASTELRPGAPGGRTPRLPVFPTPGTVSSAPGISGVRSGSGVGEPTVGADGSTRGDTCHVDVVDRHGNMVSATPSGGWLQSSPTIPELGWRGCPPRCGPARARAPRCRRRSRCGTAGRGWRSARQAATSRTSGA
jgi:gamma-glutamyltranspeptidase/glutathione hydrolase